MRDKLIDLFHEKNSKYQIFCDGCFSKEPEELNAAMALLADYLIANGVTVREKGTWEIHKDDYEICATEFTCSNCKCDFCSSKLDDEIFLGVFNFCPNCGADMRNVLVVEDELLKK